MAITSNNQDAPRYFVNVLVNGKSLGGIGIFENGLFNKKIQNSLVKSLEDVDFDNEDAVAEINAKLQDLVTVSVRENMADTEDEVLF